MNVESGEYLLSLSLLSQAAYAPEQLKHKPDLLSCTTMPAFTELMHIFRLSQGQTYLPETCLTCNFSQQLRFVAFDD